MTQIQYINEGFDRTFAADDEPRLNITAAVRYLRRYGSAILLTAAAVAIAYLVVQPVRRTASLHFRLDFAGADRNEYPNGVRFSPAEIVDSAILRVRNVTVNPRELLFSAPESDEPRARFSDWPVDPPDHGRGEGSARP